MNENSDYFNKQGVKLLHGGKIVEAIDSFTKAIEIDPSLASAFKNRGEAYLLLNRIIDAKADMQISQDLQSGKILTTESEVPNSSITINDIINLSDTVFPGSMNDE